MSASSPFYYDNLVLKQRSKLVLFDSSQTIKLKKQRLTDSSFNSSLLSALLVEINNRCKNKNNTLITVSQILSAIAYHLITKEPRTALKLKASPLFDADYKTSMTYYLPKIFVEDLKRLKMFDNGSLLPKLSTYLYHILNEENGLEKLQQIAHNYKKCLNYTNYKHLTIEKS